MPSLATHPDLGSAKLLSTAALLLLAACASNGSAFATTKGAGGADNNTGGAGTVTGTGATMGIAGDCVDNGGDATGPAGSTGTGGNEGGGAGGPACPKGADQICHEFYANDNSRHRLNYVNEFTGDPARGYVVWFAQVSSCADAQKATGNSPRTIELVDNPNAKSGKAVLVSLETGYAEFDTTDGTKLAQITGYAGISGACRFFPANEPSHGNGDS